MKDDSRRCTNIPDKHGRLIFENDRCRSWRESGTFQMAGFWLIEVVRFYNGTWYLFEEGFDYKKNNDEPSLLIEHHNEIEVFEAVEDSQP
ncbi:MAG: hypothetical protein HUJ25_07545 [Crocinitomicaceae bacterium]|nr:hypothetical protein [Crocinitomicaceae bacterium]